MYKYNKYKKKYLNLVYGGSSRVNDIDDTYTINIYNFNGDKLYYLTLNNDVSITVNDLIKYINKINEINFINVMKEYYLEFILNESKLKYTDGLSKTDINDGNNIMLYINKHHIIDLYDLLNILMQNDNDYWEDDSLTSWLYRKKEICTYIDEIKIHMPHINDFFIIYSEKPIYGSNIKLKINFYKSNIFITIIWHDHHNPIDKYKTITKYLLDHGEYTYFSNNNYIYSFLDDYNYGLMITISKNTNDNFTDDDLQCLSLIEVKGTESKFFVEKK